MDRADQIRELKKLKGKRISADLEDGQSRTGFLHAVDPDTGALLLLVQHARIENPADAASAFGASVIFLRAVKAYSEDLSSSTVQYKDAVKNCEHLLGNPVVRESWTPELMEQRKQALLDFFKKRHIDVRQDGHNLILMNGIVTVEPPYSERGCHTSNALVLEKVVALVREAATEGAQWKTE